MTDTQRRDKVLSKKYRLLSNQVLAEKIALEKIYYDEVGMTNEVTKLENYRENCLKVNNFVVDTNNISILMI